MKVEFIEAIREAAGGEVAAQAARCNKPLALTPSALKSLGRDAEQWRTGARAVGLEDGRIFLTLCFNFGEAVYGAIVDTLKASNLRGEIGLDSVLEALQRMGRWLLRDGLITWCVSDVEPGRVRISVMAPRPIARAVKVEAARAGQTISDYVLEHLPVASGKAAHAQKEDPMKSSTTSA